MLPRDSNRGISRRHVAAALIALAVSVGLHATVLTRIDSLHILPQLSRVETKRFTSIQMTDVSVEPPVIDRVDRQPLENPDIQMDAGGVGDESSVINAPEPLRLPLPEPVPKSAETQPDAPVELAASIRQEVLAIQDRLYEEEVSALPRSWIEQDIPRIDQAPDIQLPVSFTDSPPVDRDIPESIQPAQFIEDYESGTPDWSALMFTGGDGDYGAAAPVVPQAGNQHLDELLDERPEEVSQLEAIENLLQVRVSGSRGIGDDDSIYFALHIERASENVLPVQPRDILFIQDSSESITPWKLDECRRGLKRWLDFLNPGDRFELLSFRDDITPCFGGWRDYDASSRREAFGFIDALRAEGNTDVYKSIRSAMSIEPDPGRTMLVILITDGRPTVGVIGSSEIIEGVTRANQGRVSMFTVGGGKKVNSFFLDLMSYRNRGDAIVVKGDEEIPGAMEEWAVQLRRPVLTDLSYSFAGAQDADIYPRQLTHLFLDRPLIINGRLPADVDRFVFQVVGRSGTEWHDMIFVINREDIAMGSRSIREQWAWQKIYHMIGEYIGAETPEKLEAIRSFADQQGLNVPYGFSRALPRGD